MIAIPTLIKKLPAPIRTLVGDLSDKEKVLIGLNIKPA
ncbi:circadian clock KaiB family protein [Mucilaginibacter sp.]